ncbi:MAG: hypothetical protein A2046_04520 [Bacteroidetes bacterium GWA2_30_7]|nr:MAG: hypothetical protein A2046_04520 [Bacteroidetes bacterium GWA2_30_7]
MSKEIKYNNNIFGVFNNEEVLITAIKSIKNSGVKIKNVFTPYPIHEVFHELGLKTRFPYFAFVFGVLGTVLTFGFLFWTSVIDFPITIGGKPNLSMSFVIIMFVMTINIGIVLSLGAFFTIQKLFPGKNPVIVHPDITDDKYVIVIEKKNEMTKEEVAGINDLLRKNGAIETGMKKNVESI